MEVVGRSKITIFCVEQAMMQMPRHYLVYGSEDNTEMEHQKWQLRAKVFDFKNIGDYFKERVPKIVQFGTECKHMAEVTGWKFAFFTYVGNVRIYLDSLVLERWALWTSY